MATNHHHPIIAIIQARMGSTRLPGKVLLEISGKPMVVWVVERAMKALSLDEVVVATTTDPADDAVEATCKSWSIPCFRGSVDNVLERYYQAAKLFQANTIVRLTADCPLIDPNLIDLTVHGLMIPHTPHFDFSCTRLPPPWKRTFPIGLDVEVCRFESLQRVWREYERGNLLPHHREHVMPYLYEEDHSNHFRFIVGEHEVPQPVNPNPILAVTAQSPAGTIPQFPDPFQVLVLDHFPDYGSYRWTVDTSEDLRLVREVFSRLPDRENFDWYDVLELVKADSELAIPEFSNINQDTKHKDYREVDQDFPRIDTEMSQSEHLPGKPNSNAS